MKRMLFLTVAAALILAVIPAAASSSKNYSDISLSGGSRSGGFSDEWDITACDLVLSFTVDLSGVVDDPGAHAYSRFGVRDSAAGSGVWLATDHDSAANTFDPDPALDLDDKLHLQKAGGHDEGDYNLPSPPPDPSASHRFWFDRDGVDASHAQNPLAVDGGTYNTGGQYDIVISLHASSSTSGEAYLTINGLNQGFETDGDSTTMELSPAGMTFAGDMEQMQVFYALAGAGATHNVAFQSITVTGCLVPPPPTPVPPTPVPPTPTPPPAPAEQTYVVVPGDTLYGIAGRFGVTVQDIATRNGIINPNLIYVGQVIIIPIPGSAPPEPGPAVGERIHVVLPGQNLFRIALTCGTSFKTVAVYNGIGWPYLIFPGQEIRIPAPAGEPVSPLPGEQIHIVQPGENLFRIALRYRTSFGTLAIYNGIAWPYTIYAGQVIRIPPSG